MRHFNLMMTDVLEVGSDVMINTTFCVLNKLWGLDPLIIKIIALCKTQLI